MQGMKMRTRQKVRAETNADQLTSLVSALL